MLSTLRPVRPRRSLLAGGAALLVLMAGLGTATPGAAAEGEAPTRLQVDSVTARSKPIAVGTRVTITVVISNRTDVRKPARTIRLFLKSAEDRTFGLGNSRVSSLASGATTSVRVSRIAPLEAPAGLYVAQACLKPDTLRCGRSEATVTIKPARLVSTPATLAFGEVPLGTTSEQQSVTITNRGHARTGVVDVDVDDPFAIATSGCAESMDPGASCQVSVVYRPDAEGAAAGDLVASGRRGGATSVALTGTGLGAAELRVTPSTHDFGAYSPGTSGYQEFIIQNTGTGTAEPVEVTIGGADAADFLVTGCPAVLAPGAACSVTVLFTPGSHGDKRATMTVTGAPGGTADLMGLGAPAGITLVPTAYDYGAVAVGDSVRHTFRVVNTTDDAESISHVGSSSPFGLDVMNDFTCVVTADEIAPHRWCTITIEFRPQSTGFVSRTLEAGGPNFDTTSTLSGTGVEAGGTSQQAAPAQQPMPTTVTLRDGEPVVSRD